MIELEEEEGSEGLHWVHQFRWPAQLMCFQETAANVRGWDNGMIYVKEGRGRKSL